MTNKKVYTKKEKIVAPAPVKEAVDTSSLIQKVRETSDAIEKSKLFSEFLSALSNFKAK